MDHVCVKSAKLKRRGGTEPTNCLEAVIRIAFAPALGEAHENAIHLLRFRLEHKLDTQITHGREDTKASPIEQFHEGFPNAGACQGDVAQNGGGLCLLSRRFIAGKHAQRMFTI